MEKTDEGALPEPIYNLALKGEYGWETVMKNTETAELARQVIENPAFSMAIEDMRQGMLRQWIETGDTEEGREIREAVWKNSKLLGIFVSVLKGYIERASLSDKVERP